MTAHPMLRPATRVMWPARLAAMQPGVHCGTRVLIARMTRAPADPPRTSGHRPGRRGDEHPFDQDSDA